jgi:hypothetical protein
MRASGAMLMAFATVFLQDTSFAQACGDKFLVVGRGVRFQRAYAAIYPASIVVYARTERAADKAIRNPRLQDDLKAAGHHVSLVENEAALTKALESGHVDLVLTDVADADRVARQAESAPAKPRVLPVMYDPTPEEVKQIEARYQCRLKSSDHIDRYLVTIDDAMKARAEQKKKNKTS